MKITTLDNKFQNIEKKMTHLEETLENKILNDIISQKKYIHLINVNENADFEEEYEKMITYLENTNKINEDEVFEELIKYYADVNTEDYQVQKLNALMGEDKKNLMGDPEYAYEFVLIHYGALIFSRADFDEYFNYREKKCKSDSTKMKENWWNNDVINMIGFTVMKKIYTNHKKYHEDSLKLVKDITLIEKLKRVMKES